MLKIKLRKVRLSFANGLFVAGSVKGGKPKFGADFLLVPGFTCHKVADDGAEVAIEPLAALLEEANNTWKGRGKEMLGALEGSKKSLRDGNKKMKENGQPYDDYQGLLFFTAKNKTQPSLFDIDGKTPITNDNGRLYSGCYVTVIISLEGNADPEFKGVHGKLLGVQYTGEGEMFEGGARVAAANEFDDLSAGADAPAINGSSADSMAGLL